LLNLQEGLFIERDMVPSLFLRVEVLAKRQRVTGDGHLLWSHHLLEMIKVRTDFRSEGCDMVILFKKVMCINTVL
jgi:hypothetical protein